MNSKRACSARFRKFISGNCGAIAGFFSILRVNALTLSLIFLSSHAHGETSSMACVGQRNDLITSPKIAQDAEKYIADNKNLFINAENREFEISKNDKIKGYLYGTMHTPNARTTFLTPLTYFHFIKSDALVVETNIASSSTAQITKFQEKILSLANIKEKHSLIAMLGPAYQRELISTTNQLSISLDKFDDMSFFEIENILSSAYCTDMPGRLNRGGHAIDIILSSWATYLKKDIIEIEPLEHSLDALIETNHSDHLSFIKFLLRRKSEMADIINFELTQYSLGRIDRAIFADTMYLATKDEQEDLSARQRHLITDRNPTFMPFIENSLSKADSTFVAVGAGHLIGDDGLVARLRRLGWTVRPCSDHSCANQ